MIVFDLQCGHGHDFEGWFGSSQDFAEQQKRGLLVCPHCGAGDVVKAPMSPAVGRKGNQLVSAKEAGPVAGGALSPEAKAAFSKLAVMQSEALKQSRWVGDGFAEQSREMHYGEREAETIHGQATLEQAKDLLEEGIAVMPLPFPVAPPPEKLN
jgi:hypothetical protein